MKVNLSSSRSYSNDISPRADISFSQLSISGDVETEAIKSQRQVDPEAKSTVKSAPIQKQIDAPVSAPVIQKIQEPKQNGVHLPEEETKPKPVAQTLSTLKAPIPTSVLKSQVALHSVKKAEPPKRVMMNDLEYHQWPQTPKIKVTIISAVEINVFTLHVEDPKIEKEYERIASEIANYCQDKKSCGYKPLWVYSISFINKNLILLSTATTKLFWLCSKTNGTAHTFLKLMRMVALSYVTSNTATWVLFKLRKFYRCPNTSNSISMLKTSSSIVSSAFAS